MQSIVVKLSLALWLASVVAGCGEQPTTVAGKVTLDDKPLTIGQSQRGTVVFHPVAGGALATALITGDGSYRATTGGSASLAPGEYLVAVRVLEVVPRTDSAEATGKPLTPAVYADPSTSGLKFTITPGNNVCDLALRSDAGPAMAPDAVQASPDSPATDSPALSQDDADEDR